MKRREHEIVETFKSLSEHNKQVVLEQAKKKAEALEENRQFHNNYYIKQAMRDRQHRDRSRLMEGARNDALSTIVKAIYITALEAEALTDEGLLLAESMVDNWIKEAGGASRILTKVGNNSYLLSRITQIVEDAAEAEVKEIEADEAEDEAPIEKSDKDEAIDVANNFIKNADKDELKNFIDNIKSLAGDRKELLKSEEDAEKAHEEADKADEKLAKIQNKEAEKEADVEEEESEESEEKEDKAEDTSAENDEDIEIKDDEVSDDKDDESKDKDTEDKSKSEDDEEDPLSDDLDNEDTDDDDDVGELPEEDDEEKDPDIDYSVEDDIEVDDDDDDEDITIDGDEESDDVDDADDNESHGKVFDELEKEDDVKKAIDLIRTRVADAEQKFIKNNAEDKKKIDDLLSKISQNVKTVEDMDEKGDDDKKEIASESVRMDKRRIDAIRNNRPLTIFECMTRKYSANVIKDEKAKVAYLNESGSIDTGLIVESAKVMYAFLETLNTLQLEKVDSKYIKNVLDNM